MSERVFKTGCPGVGEKGVGLLTDIEAAPVTVSEDQFGVIKINCPFLNGRGGCGKGERGIDMPPICRFIPRASYETPKVYSYPFNPPHIYKKIWDSLSPQAKEACLEFSPYAFGGMEEEAFRGMCLVFGLGKSNGEVEKILAEVLENGAIERMSYRESLNDTLKIMENEEVEDIEVRGGSKEKAQIYKKEILAEIVDYEETLQRYKDNPRWHQTLESMRNNMQRPTLRFTPGFQLFVDQYYIFADQYYKVD